MLVTRAEPKVGRERPPRRTTQVLSTSSLNLAPPASPYRIDPIRKC
jgi:hypothetical protein